MYSSLNWHQVFKSVIYVACYVYVYELNHSPQSIHLLYGCTDSWYMTLYGCTNFVIYDIIWMYKLSDVQHYMEYTSYPWLGFNLVLLANYTTIYLYTFTHQNKYIFVHDAQTSIFTDTIRSFETSTKIWEQQPKFQSR